MGASPGVAAMVTHLQAFLSALRNETPCLHSSGWWWRVCAEEEGEPDTTRDRFRSQGPGCTLHTTRTRDTTCKQAQIHGGVKGTLHVLRARIRVGGRLTAGYLLQIELERRLGACQTHGWRPSGGWSDVKEEVSIYPSLETHPLLPHSTGAHLDRL